MPIGKTIMAMVKNASLARVPGATLALDDDDEPDADADFLKDALETEPEEDMACVYKSRGDVGKGRRGERMLS